MSHIGRGKGKDGVLIEIEKDEQRIFLYIAKDPLNY
jgi:hypothetical protein